MNRLSFEWDPVVTIWKRRKGEVSQFHRNAAAILQNFVEADGRVVRPYKKRVGNQPAARQLLRASKQFMCSYPDLETSGSSVALPFVRARCPILILLFCGCG